MVINSTLNVNIYKEGLTYILEISYFNDFSLIIIFFKTLYSTEIEGYQDVQCLYRTQLSE